MRVSMFWGQLVQVKQSLVDGLLKLQCVLHGIQPIDPLITFRFLWKKKKTKHEGKLRSNLLLFKINSMCGSSPVWTVNMPSPSDTVPWCPGGRCVLLSCSGRTAASQRVPAPHDCSPWRSGRSLAGPRHPGRSGKPVSKHGTRGLLLEDKQ